MSSSRACLIIFYDGDLNIDDQFFPTYSRGKNRPIQVPSSLSFDDLKVRIISSLKHDPRLYTISLVCRFPAGNSYVASHILDDEICEVVLSLATREPLVVSAEIERKDIEISSADPSQVYSTQQSYPSYPYTSSDSVAQAIFDSASIERERPHIAQHCIGSTSNVQHRESMIFTDLNTDDISTEPGLPVIEEGYEIMPSTSSDDCSSDDDVLSHDSEVNININQNSNELLKQYSIRNSCTEDQMIANNDYVRDIRNTSEWNAMIEFDGPGCGDETTMQSYIPSKLYEGMCFATKQDLKFAVNGWSIINNVEFKYFSSNKKKYTILCLQSENQSRPCKWRMHASCQKRQGGAWVISKLEGPHTCMHPVMNIGHRQCNSSFICYFIMSAIRHQINLKSREIIGRIEAKFNIRVSYMKAWDARRKAIKSVFGSWEESYRSIGLFVEVISTVMPGTVYRIRNSSSHRFERLFWSFGPSIRGWQYCRPVLCLDGTFLLGKYRGTLLTAIAIDANNGLFPLAFAVVESESIESWIWFLTCIAELLPMVHDRRDLCIISDKHTEEQIAVMNRDFGEER